MAGIKRKTTTEAPKPKSKKFKSSPIAAKSALSPSKSKSKKQPAKQVSAVDSDLDQSDTTEDENGFVGFSAKEGPGDSNKSESESAVSSDDELERSQISEKAKATENVKASQRIVKKTKGLNIENKVLGENGALGASNSRDAHQKQKALARERRAAKPNADIIAQSKKLWEKLRRKSHVPKDERQKLVGELFDIITGRVKDFVFKHDSVRVIQCALKYANQEQREQIAAELKGEFKPLAESRYAKFLVAKLVVEGGSKVRDIIVPEFYGHVKRLINHPEASWIVDDIYRGVATTQQKAILLREWYGPEFSIFKSAENSIPTSDLATILQESPEKRKPIMAFLKIMINQLIQKKMTGFTMLHDAMLQYFLNTTPGTEEASEFLQIITPTPATNKEQKEEADNEPEIDLLKNLAFTASGSRVVCLALAYSNAKERKQILRAYKDAIDMLAFDTNGQRVLITVYDVFDDTRQVATAIFNELVGKEASETQHQKVLALATHVTGRLSLLYPFTGAARGLVSGPEQAKIAEVIKIRETTSKKQPEIRRAELIKALSSTCLDSITTQAGELMQSSFGCQFISEIMLDADGDKSKALASVAEAAAGDPKEEGSVARSPFAGRMLKTLVLGGRFDAKTKQVSLSSPPLLFKDILYEQIKEFVVDWACSASSLVVANMLEGEGFSFKDDLLRRLNDGKVALKEAADVRENGKADADENPKNKKKLGGNVGAKMLLGQL